MSAKPLVLFLCTGNSCRSQMAEAFLRQMAGDRFEAHSAGMAPADHLHPLAIQAMAEVGIDISAQQPKDVSRYLGRQRLAWLIVVCDQARQSCPRVWPMLDDQHRHFWSLPDPATATGAPEQQILVFRHVRDAIRRLLADWLASLPDHG